MKIHAVDTKFLRRASSCLHAMIYIMKKSIESQESMREFIATLFNDFGFAGVGEILPSGKEGEFLLRGMDSWVLVRNKKGSLRPHQGKIAQQRRNTALAKKPCRW